MVGADEVGAVLEYHRGGVLADGFGSGPTGQRTYVGLTGVFVGVVGVLAAEGAVEEELQPTARGGTSSRRGPGPTRTSSPRKSGT